ncbi:YceI family protein [Defluviimonas aestuarii]|uniref:YceI family protein n=1 Tax=Albidovulum aestuarii TaxID=1130726 RepID=UPI00249A3ED6|nr:YceI family protein [Defluviimonas aestuarii]MDI3338523.1 YceI family protein [Defluviimonas aestuarii]
MLTSPGMGRIVVHEVMRVMVMFRSALYAALLTVSSGTASVAGESPAITPKPTEAPAGHYILDAGHTRLMFSVSHLGFSNYTAFFTGVEAELDFDPVRPKAMRLVVRIDPASVTTLFPDPSVDFDGVIAGESFLDAKAYPAMSFESRTIHLTAPDRAAVTGGLTLHGVTRTITLSVIFNGGYAGHPLDPGGARIGFSATGTIWRSDFGIGFGIPAPGTTLGIGDEVAIRIEAEFINPDVSGPQLGP